ncbi:alpha/beta hydrolase [candidate division KSB1 bacterium]|nr:alpha/beta hydrolase [candidate division KSB1 bacterium]
MIMFRTGVEMSKIIIGIHGLKNKPPERLLRKWWKQAIKDGLRAVKHPRIFFPFELVYWSDYFYPQPLNKKIKDREHPLFIHDPYISPTTLIRRKKSSARQKFLNFLEKQMDGIFLNRDMSINFSGITDLIIRRFFNDLDTYYSKYTLDKFERIRPAKDVIRNELAGVLRKHRKKQIMLICHSMGSIIAYDVLTQTAPDVDIHTFVTMGSPLGMPFIMSKNYQEQKKILKRDIKCCTTPENVREKWYNFSDLKDRVALNYNLADDYFENSHHVKVIDKIVYNDYEMDGERNPHKSYGYLRTPEVSQVIWEFLTEGKPIWWVKCVDAVNRIFQPAKSAPDQESTKEKDK